MIVSYCKKHKKNIEMCKCEVRRTAGRTDNDKARSHKWCGG